MPILTAKTAPATITTEVVARRKALADELDLAMVNRKAATDEAKRYAVEVAEMEKRLDELRSEAAKASSRASYPKDNVDAIRHELHQTCPPEIDAAVLKLDEDLEEFNSRRRTTTKGSGATLVIASNSPAIDQHVLESLAAKKALAELRLQPLSAKEFSRAIAKILAGVRRPILDLVELSR